MTMSFFDALGVGLFLKLALGRGTIPCIKIWAWKATKGTIRQVSNKMHSFLDLMHQAKKSKHVLSILGIS